VLSSNPKKQHNRPRRGLIVEAIGLIADLYFE